MRKGGPRPPWIDRIRKKAGSDPEARERLRRAGKKGAQARIRKIEQNKLYDEAIAEHVREENERIILAEQKRTGKLVDIGIDPDA